MTRDAPRDPLLSDAFQVLVREGASAAQPDGLVPLVRARVRRRRAARRVGAGVTGLAVVAGAALAVPHVLPSDGPGLHGPAGTAMVPGDHAVYTLAELGERADIVFEGLVFGVEERTAASQTVPAGLPTAIEHPGGGDLSVGWFCAAWDGSTPHVTRSHTSFFILGLTDEEADVVWEQAHWVLGPRCSEERADVQGAGGDPGDGDDTFANVPTFLLVGPDINDLGLSVRLDPEVTITDLCPGTDEQGFPAECNLQGIKEEFQAAFPTFEVEEDRSIRRLEPPAVHLDETDPEAADADPEAVEDEDVPVRLVHMLIDTLHVDTRHDGLQPPIHIVVVQAADSAWEPPLVEGRRYLIFGEHHSFGEHRIDGAVAILGGSAGAFVDDGLGGWLPVLQASSPVRHLSAEQLVALLRDGDEQPGDGVLLWSAWQGPLPLPGDRAAVHAETVGLVGRLPMLAWSAATSDSADTEFYVSTRGPEFCPTVATGVAWDGSHLHVTVQHIDHVTGEVLVDTAGCRGDLVPFTTRVQAPEGVLRGVLPAVVSVESPVESPAGCVRRYHGYVGGDPVLGAAPEADTPVCG